MFPRQNPTISRMDADASHPAGAPPDGLDRAVVAYLFLPLVIFLAGWLAPWAAVPLLVCVAYAVVVGLRPRTCACPVPAGAPLTPRAMAVAIAAGSVWAAVGGTDHWVFANADWHMRDALLHDLVVGRWPVGYGEHDGMATLLRAPLAYFLPAAVVGKWAGLPAAHLALLIWTATGASLFLLQVVSLAPSRTGSMVAVVAIVALFSGLDVVGTLIDVGPSDRTAGHLGTHLEWWAGLYQYSSMTTQLFWVPNHAFGSWLTIGLLARHRRDGATDALLPMVLVAIALWSPFAAIGCLPFIVCHGLGTLRRDRAFDLLHPRIWAPALVVGLVVAGYLTYDAATVGARWAGGRGDSAIMVLLRHVQFFLLEAGLIGVALMRLRRSVEIYLALLILALLPFAVLGPGNDLVMRASIPSLTVLAIACALALVESLPGGAVRPKLALAGLLAIGAVTPVHEIARSFELPVWPINLEATLVDADCGHYPPHYVARLSDAPITRVLRVPQALLPGPVRAANCDNPAFFLMWMWNVI
jgi:hypothetical protein